MYSMNKYGAVLDSIGFSKLADDVVDKIVKPMASILFKETGKLEAVNYDKPILA